MNLFLSKIKEEIIHTTLDNFFFLDKSQAYAKQRFEIYSINAS